MNKIIIFLLSLALIGTTQNTEATRTKKQNKLRVKTSEKINNFIEQWFGQFS